MNGDRDVFNFLGFTWDRSQFACAQDIEVSSKQRVIARFSRMLSEYVWDAGVLEGNPFTLPEVQTVIDGITVGGRKLSDHEQIVNLVSSTRLLTKMVQDGSFVYSKAVACQLHAAVARNEALEWGVFRGEGAEVAYTPDVFLGEKGRMTPIRTEAGAPELNSVFAAGAQALTELPAWERASAAFLFGALQQFFFDGNKRTSRLMMNGILMQNAMDAISVPAARAAEFNTKMVDFYVSRDATGMMHFLGSCHPSVRELLSQAHDERNPAAPPVRPRGG